MLPKIVPHPACSILTSLYFSSFLLFLIPWGWPLLWFFIFLEELQVCRISPKTFIIVQSWHCLDKAICHFGQWSNTCNTTWAGSLWLSDQRSLRLFCRGQQKINRVVFMTQTVVSPQFSNMCSQLVCVLSWRWHKQQDLAVLQEDKSRWQVWFVCICVFGMKCQCLQSYEW